MFNMYNIYIYIYVCYMLCGKKGTGGYDKEGRQPTRHNIYTISTHKSLYIHVILCQNSMARLFGPVYTWSLHAFSLIGYLSDLLKCLNLHLATSMCLRKTDINQFFNSRQWVHVNESNRYALHFIHYQLISISETATGECGISTGKIG